MANELPKLPPPVPIIEYASKRNHAPSYPDWAWAGAATVIVTAAAGVAGSIHIDRIDPLVIAGI
ncbi:MAG TPA: hypothetical protein VHY37_00040, partial [Tepidisphaeraceae bacterium]|nr:hypothetical protein [Tepidisphaeraceae bacterium]